MNGDKQKAEGSGGEEELPEEEPSQFYDKTKSFFDNISCEATERSKGYVLNRSNVLPSVNSFIFHGYDTYVCCAEVVVVVENQTGEKNGR